MKKSTAKIMHYTIVEMMMVIAVFMIMLSMAMVAWLNSGSQANLKNAARLFSAQLNLAKAKAVANRTLVRLEITEDNDRYKIEMFYGESGTQKPHDVEPIYLPRGVFFAEDQGVDTNGNPKLYTDGKTFKEFEPDSTAPEIVFTNTGKLKSTADKRFYLIGECPDGKVRSGQVYYIITVKLFSGRIKTKLETVAD